MAAHVAAPVAAVSSPVGAGQSDSFKGGIRPFDKDLLRNFIIGAMPFGTPQDLNYGNVTLIITTGYSADPLPTDQVLQPAWKPYLYKGKQRTLFSSLETINVVVSPDSTLDIKLLLAWSFLFLFVVIYFCTFVTCVC